VTTAHALSEAQTSQLRDTLQLALGQDVRVETRIDPEILGGLIVKAGSRMFDSSIRSKLNNLTHAMKEVR
jgi:F-type H+-transporting ATPase subunit delta